MTLLRQRMLDALVLRGMAIRTQEAYIEAVARLAAHYGRGPDTLTAEEVQHYLLHLLHHLDEFWRVLRVQRPAAHSDVMSCDFHHVTCCSFGNASVATGVGGSVGRSGFSISATS